MPDYFSSYIDKKPEHIESKQVFQNKSALLMYQERINLCKGRIEQSNSYS